MKRISIEYCPDGVPIGDAKCKDLALVYANPDFHCLSTHKISTFQLIYEIRVLVKTGKISLDELEIFFEGEEMKLDQHAKFEHWPKGFGDYAEICLHALL